MTQLFIGSVSGLTPQEIVEIFGAKDRVTSITVTAPAAGGGSTKTSFGISTANNLETTTGETARGVKTRRNVVAALFPSTK
ncbi:MAG: hypothetical protein EBZ69_00775 [Alphaproteobacteria bacterium]|nr:hypothetical protein [Alphaproteobacteria bacterium]